MSDTRTPPGDGSSSRSRPAYRPSERFWPYVDVTEEPTPEELATLDPDLYTALFGRRDRPFSMTLSFPRFDGEDYARAVELARRAPEHVEVGTGDRRRHRVRFYPHDARALRDLYEIVESHEGCEVLVDDRPVPFARELWLPLMWLLIGGG